MELVIYMMTKTVQLYLFNNHRILFPIVSNLQQFRDFLVCDNTWKTEVCISEIKLLTFLNYCVYQLRPSTRNFKHI